MKVAKSELATALKTLQILETDLQTFEEEIEENGAPWTPGRMPLLDVK
jgi:hypothetical protein